MLANNRETIRRSAMERPTAARIWQTRLGFFYLYVVFFIGCTIGLYGVNPAAVVVVGLLLAAPHMADSIQPPEVSSQVALRMISLAVGLANSLLFAGMAYLIGLAVRLVT